MCLIPLKSDCDLYHWPFATGGLILTNIAAAYATGLGEAPLASDWMLAFGQGMNPLQWVTHSFVHFGIVHLIGNMIFLWAFGIGVEGRIGWWRFLLLYLGIGIVGGLLGQFWMSDAVGLTRGAGGASLAVFGIMAVALLWHPFAEIECLCLFVMWGRAAVAERIGVAVLWFAGFYIAKEIYFSASVYGSTDGSPTSATFHTLGAVLGAGIGYVMLQRKLVDCEDQDIFNVGKTSSYFDKFKKPQKNRTLHGDVAEESPVTRPEADDREVVSLLKEFVDNEQWDEAFQAFARLSGRQQQALPESDVKRLGDGLFREGRHDDAAAAYTCLLESGHNSSVVRLKLAAILLDVRSQPRAALRVIDDLPVENLSPAHCTKRDHIRDQAEQMIDAGHIELSSQ